MARTHSFVTLALCAFSAITLTNALSAQTPVPLYDPQTRHANFTSAQQPANSPGAPNGCTLVTFEGLADLAAIPQIQGINLPDWLSIIEDSAGGSGNFSNPPSGVTIAFWLYGNPTSQNILIPNSANSISLYYASYYPMTLQAYDASGTLLNSVTGPANFDSGTSSYDIWSPLKVAAPNGKTIASLTVIGYANYTGIDNLNVCQSPVIDSVEITQAIQQYQTLSDLESTLQTNGEPPVPIIANKPAAMRLYFSQVQAVTDINVQVSGVTSDSKPFTLQPNCPDENQRAGTNGCKSLDFFFTPPSGSWQATLDVLDSNGNKVQEEVLNVNSRNTDSLRLRGVTVCSSDDPSSCDDASNLLPLTGLLTKLAPTNTVTVDIPNDTVTNDLSSYTNLTPIQGSPNWWSDTVAQVGHLYGLLDWLGDTLAGRRTTYFGMIQPSVGGLAGLANGIPSHGAMSLSSGDGFPVGQTVAHETGHTLNLKHTNTKLPASGCFAIARAPDTDWKYPTGVPASMNNTNYIQSSAGKEVGFDVTAGMPLDPNSTFELMGYCTPSWISPQRYKTMIETLKGGGVSSPSLKAAPATAASPAPFWVVSGTLPSSGVQFDPLFQLTIDGNNTAGSGTYTLIVQGASGQALFTRYFTPETPPMEDPNSTVAGPPNFSETLPVMSNATAIVLRDPNGIELGRITLGGTAPSVKILTPGAGFVGSGNQTITWTVQNPGSANLTARVLFSSNRGSTWSFLGQTRNFNSLTVDFDKLPGSATAEVQVLVSNGVNTGTAISPLFSIPKKLPITVNILSPTPNSARPSANPVYLTGYAYNVDDGVLSGSALQWKSSIGGPLGSGSPLSVKLDPGTHVITLTATDSDGNSKSTTTNVIIGGQPPSLILQTQALDKAPTTCESATITAQPGKNGAPLSLVQYSVDGGKTYTTVPLTSLPYKFISPGSGFIYMVARAYDTSNQATMVGTSFLTQSACETGQPVIQGSVATKGLQSPGTYAVTVTFKNIGTGLSKQATMNVTAQRLSGAGTVTYAGSNPISLPGLAPGQSVNLQLLFTVPNPNTVTRFSIRESGTLVDAFGTSAAFSTSQQVIP